MNFQWIRKSFTKGTGEPYSRRQGLHRTAQGGARSDDDDMRYLLSWSAKVEYKGCPALALLARRRHATFHLRTMSTEAAILERSAPSAKETSLEKLYSRTGSRSSQFGIAEQQRPLQLGHISEWEPLTSGNRVSHVAYSRIRKLTRRGYNRRFDITIGKEIM